MHLVSVLNAKYQFASFCQFMACITVMIFASGSLEIEKADIIFTSNKTITMVGEKIARPLSIAVNGERIVWIGSPEQATNILGRHIILEDKAILPGFIDAHGHASYLALTSQFVNVASPPVGAVEGIKDLKAVLKKALADKKLQPGEWLIGFGYDDSLLKEQRHPTRDDLDEISREIPVYLIHVSGHLGVANSKALSITKISAASPNPPGGKIRRYLSSSEPNGVVEETAAYPLQKMAMASVKNPIDGYEKAIQVYARHGITTAQDGAASAPSLALLKMAAKKGHLKIDIIAYVVGQDIPISQIRRLNFGQYENRVKLGGIKLILDGSPQGKTAYLSEPYLKPPSGEAQSYRGYPIISQTAVNERIRAFSEAKIPILAHANGDAAADMLIEGIKKANIKTDHRTVMIHAQTLREDQLDEMKFLNIIPSFFSANTFYWGDWHRDSVLGPIRANRISPTNSTVRRNMPFTVHNDAPIVPPNMVRLLWATTNRLTRSGKILGEGQRISIYETLEAITINAAYQHFEEGDKGSIEVGKLADFVIVSEDPLRMTKKSLMTLKIIATYSRGQEIFRLGDESLF